MYHILIKLQTPVVKRIGAGKNREFRHIGQTLTLKINLKSCLILIGLFEVYSYTVYHKWYLLLIGIIFLGIGLKQLKTVLTYSYVIETETKNLKFGKLNLQFDNVQTGTLKEMKLGKRVTPVIDMITNDKKQIVIPLFMAKQERFVLLLKEILADKFSIKK